MELSELVREIESAHDPAAQARIERSRSTVMRGIAQPRPRRSRRRWVWGGTAAGTVTAGAIAATVIIAGTVSPLAAPPASAAAVAVLNDAAGAAMTSPDPVLAPGQYLRMRETYDLITLWDADLDPSDPVFGFSAAALDQSEGAVFQRSIRDLYVPSDRAGDWIIDDRQVNEVRDVFGDPATLPAFEAMVAEVGDRDADPGGLVALPGGIAKEGESWEPFRDEYATMPRDPEKLLEWFRERLAAYGDDDWIIFQNIGHFLSTDVMPAELRAATLHTVALLSGVEVARTDGSVTTLRMESHLDEGSEFGDLLVSEIDINTESGHIVGGREVYPHRPTDLLPAELPWVSWTVDFEIVDEAPQP
ncbi:hypothetical protein [Microbacterium galbinum]|uniref:Uncharacterized protein n=1 Tax=Microbacterium galbinum TaxID=2851646 RepID=A0ABY4IPR0_9MICO|nr:hypothetical protein [Microbacterium galbinum]UPL14037.1 hypothetical protein KV396_05905 [Microbacterium galbinum]